MEIDFTVVLGFVKIFAIVVTLFHFLAGIVLIKQIFRLNRIIKTRNGPFIFSVGIAYLMVLLVVLLLIMAIQI